LQKQAIQQLQHQQLQHQPQTVHQSSSISFPFIKTDNGNEKVCTNANNIITLTWWMKQIPCPAHHPTYIRIATTHMMTTPIVVSTKEMSILHTNDNVVLREEVGNDHESTTNPTTATTITTATLKDVLRNRTMIEFPTIYITTTAPNQV
jgi:hypothetical protein